MAILKSNIRKNAYKLTNSFKKNGLCCYRYFFYARSIDSGAEVPFFIELLIENPLVSPDKVVLSRSSPSKIDDTNLQSALIGNLYQEEDSSQKENLQNKIPSYVAVRAGIYGNNRKQINCFYPVNDLKVDKKRFFLQVSDNLFSDDTLSGSLTCSKSTENNHPEYMSQAGSIQWNLHYERKIDFEEIQTSEEASWLPSGISTLFSGRIVLDSKEYSVSPKFCLGYAEKFSGRPFYSSFFNLSSSNLKSIFSGKNLENSCFVFQGNYFDKVSFLCKLENEEFVFNPKKTKYESVFSCTPVPGEESDEKLHWAVSMNNKTYVCDVDIYCSAKTMLVRDYELTCGNEKVQKILSGFYGDGELRIYKKIKKNLELIHHLEVKNSICEFGNIEQN